MIEIRTGSDSDIPKIRGAHEILRALGVPFEERILSAHRTPKLMAEEAGRLEGRGIRASIAAAGGSAHLPGMTASETAVPVVGMPVPTEHLGGLDSLFSIVQMPDGCPVGCVGIGQAEAAGLLAAQIAAADDRELIGKIRERKGLKGAEPARARSVGLLQTGALAAGKLGELRELLAAFGLEPKDGVEGRVLIVLADSGSLARPAELAGRTHAPVVAVPLAQGKLDRDPFGALLGSAPVAGMGINRVKNAAVYAAQIIGVHDPEVRAKVKAWRAKLGEESAAKDAALRRS